MFGITGGVIATILFIIFVMTTPFVFLIVERYIRIKKEELIQKRKLN